MASKHIIISVSADIITWTPPTPNRGTWIDADQGDTIDFQAAAPNPPASVTVSASKPGIMAASRSRRGPTT
jgi:hypothetical protein